jgi:hypothetical protein
MEGTSKKDKGKHLIPKGDYYIRLPRLITQNIQLMDEFGVFLKAIGNYTHLLNYTYGEYRTNDFYIGVLHQIRMLIDVICKCTAFYLTESKDTFLKRFIEDKRLDNQTYNGRQLTAKVILDYLESRYTGIRDVYDECNRYMHPTIFFYNRHKHDRVCDRICDKQSGYWFSSIRTLKEQKVVFDFFFDVSNLILIEVLTDCFNSYAVSKYGLEPIDTKKQKRIIRAYTKEALEEYKKAKKIPPTI